MTVDEMLELLPVLLMQRRGGLVGLKAVEPQGNGWVKAEFENGTALAITVEELA